jgi:two-component system, chemotaxis family, sensor kinase CheA
MVTSPRVLLVDDNRDTLDMLATFLSMAGFRVTAIESAAEALKLDFDDIFAVVTDLAMPGMDGFEFVHRLRGMRATARVPVIAVTGQAVGPRGITKRELDCCRLFIKPCDLDELTKTLEGLLVSVAA